MLNAIFFSDCNDDDDDVTRDNIYQILSIVSAFELFKPKHDRVETNFGFIFILDRTVERKRGEERDWELKIKGEIERKSLVYYIDDELNLRSRFNLKYSISNNSDT